MDKKNYRRNRARVVESAPQQRQESQSEIQTLQKALTDARLENQRRLLGQMSILSQHKEELAAGKKKLHDANQRIGSLEKIVMDLKKQLEAAHKQNEETKTNYESQISSFLKTLHFPMEIADFVQQSQQGSSEMAASLEADKQELSEPQVEAEKRELVEREPILETNVKQVKKQELVEREQILETRPAR